MPGQIVLPAGVNPGLTIHVPRGYERDGEVKIGVCRVPGCGAKFFKGQEEAWQRHVGKCARANIDRLRSMSPRNKHSGIFDEAAWDPEVASHLKTVGRRMLEEGRLEMRPSERANG